METKKTKQLNKAWKTSGLALAFLIAFGGCSAVLNNTAIKQAGGTDAAEKASTSPATQVAQFAVSVPAPDNMVGYNVLSTFPLQGTCAAEAAGVKIVGAYATVDWDNMVGSVDDEHVFAAVPCGSDHRWSVQADFSNFDDLSGYHSDIAADDFDGKIHFRIDELDADSKVLATESRAHDVDYNSPAITSVVFSTGVPVDVVNSATVNPKVNATSADEYYITLDSLCASGGTWSTSSTTQLTLDPAHGKDQVFAKVRRASGNASGCVASAHVRVDAGPLAVGSHYPGFGNWNQYVVNSGTNHMNSSGLSSGYSSGSVHAGELKKAVLAGVLNCSEVLSISDQLGVFNWSCFKDATSGEVYVSSTGIKSGKGLKDLVTEAGWRQERLSVNTSSHGLLQSSPMAWWNNPVLPLPDNSNGTSAILNQAETIYVLGTTRVSPGYRIVADGIGLVVLDGATLQWKDGSPANCAQDFQPIESLTAVCLVHAIKVNGAQTNRFWLEGSYSADAGIFTLRIQAHSNLSMRNFSVLGGYSGLTLDYIYSGRIRDGRVSNNTYNRCTICSGTVFYNLSIFNVSGDALEGYHNSNAVFTNMHFSNIGGNGLGDYGFGSYDVVHMSTFQNVTGNGIYSQESNGHVTYDQILVLNSGYGIGTATNTNNSVFSQIATYNTGTGLAARAQNLTFQNNILMGSNTRDCDTAGMPPGDNFQDVTCAPTSGATWNQVTGIDLSSSLVGKVITDDSVNSSDTNGLAAYANTLDWFNFAASYFRGWGVDGSAFPNADNQGACASGNCRIWDLRLRASDTAILNRSGDGVHANAAFVNGAPCPSAVDGSYVVTGSNKTFLANAMEVMDDGIGNDNGLCETGEACIYAPNFGAYQGEGDYTTQSCIFNDGPVVKGVKMYAYPTNGI